MRLLITQDESECEPAPTIGIPELHDQTEDVDPEETIGAPQAVTQEDEEVYYKYRGIISHRAAAPGCGSSQEVEVDWIGHLPTTWEVSQS